MASCSGTHSTIAEYTQKARVGPEVFTDSCDGCAKPELTSWHKLAMSGFSFPLKAYTPEVRLSGSEDAVEHVAVSGSAVQQPTETSGLFEASYCDVKDNSQHECRSNNETSKYGGQTD